MNTQRRQQQRGAATVEFGLSFLVFLSLMVGIMEFGRAVYSYNVLAGATREAVRYATLHGSASGSAATATDVQDVVRNWAIGLDRNAVAVTTTWSPGNGPGSTVRVQSSYTLAPFLNFVLYGPVTLRSSSQQVISQ